MEIDWSTLIASFLGVSAASLLTFALLVPTLRMQNKFNLLLARQTKWQEKELEVLTHFWRKLEYSQAELSKFVNPINIPIDLDSMDEDAVDIFFRSEGITDIEEKEMRDRKKYNEGKFGDAYSRMLYNRTANKAIETMTNSIQYFNQNKIFLEPQIKEKIEETHMKIQAVILLQLEYKNNPNTIDPFKKFNNEIIPLIKEIEKTIQVMLFPNEQQNN